MTDKEKHPGEVIPFPATRTATERTSAWEEAVFRILVAPLRANPALQEIMQFTGRSAGEIEDFLCTSRLRTRVLACLKSYLTGQLVLAVAQLNHALARGESWAFKLLLDAFKSGQFASSLREDPPDQSDVVISEAFERDVIERTLAYLRGRNDQQAQADSSET